MNERVHVNPLSMYSQCVSFLLLLVSGFVNLFKENGHDCLNVRISRITILGIVYIHGVIKRSLYIYFYRRRKMRHLDFKVFSPAYYLDRYIYIS
jgi:hypothetical protein